MCPPAFGSKVLEGARPRSNSTGDTSTSSESDDSSCFSMPEASRKKIGGMGRGRSFVKMTSQHLVLTLLLSAALAFSVGTLSRVVLLIKGLYPDVHPFHNIPDAIPIDFGMMSQQAIDESPSLAPDKSSLPDTVRSLDGIQQSSSYSEAAYHEALVHPAMMTHPNPKRVAIIGGGEGATLREVLKHSTVEEAVMIVIAEELQYLPDRSDCSDLEGSDANYCFNDSRVMVIFADAFQWFIDNFGKGEHKEQKFDVIIMDVGSLYRDDHFVDSLSNGLSEEGVFLVQLSGPETLNDPSNMIGSMQNELGFQSIHVYEESHINFGTPLSYLVCLKNSMSRARWYQTAAELEIELHQRLYKNISGKPILLYFDAPTMISYQLPSKARETAYCDSDDEPEDCEYYRGIDPEFVNIPLSHLEAKKSTVGEYAGRGLFAAQDIPMGSTIAMDVGVKAFHISPSTWSIFENLYEWTKNDDNFALVGDELSSLHTFIEGYGYKATLLGKKHFTIDSSITTFCNHGCNGSYNYGDHGVVFTEMNVDLNHAQEAVLLKADSVYSPVIERHLRQTLGFGDEIMRDINKGEEILCNYLAFVGDPEDWKEEVTDLRSQCAGEIRGEISQYESDHDSVVLANHSKLTGCI